VLQVLNLHTACHHKSRICELHILQLCLCIIGKAAESQLLLQNVLLALQIIGLFTNRLRLDSRILASNLCFPDGFTKSLGLPRQLSNAWMLMKLM
jgi:hypothetical protein